jgi:glycosylphosphatidylinositol transamidase (GPIT) subunit GPI8
MSEWIKTAIAIISISVFTYSCVMFIERKDIKEKELINSLKIENLKLDNEIKRLLLNHKD